MRGRPGSRDRGISTYRYLRAIRARNFQVVAGMTLFSGNAHLVDDTVAPIRAVVPDFAPTDLHLNVGHESPHYFGNIDYVRGASNPVRAAIERHRQSIGKRPHSVR